MSHPQNPGGYHAPSQAKPKGNRWLWIAAAVLGVAVLALLLWLFLGTGGQYVGKKMPPLPPSFAGWSAPDDTEGVRIDGFYRNGSQQVSVIANAGKPNPMAPVRGPHGDLSKPREIGKGMYCSSSPLVVDHTMCFGVWEDGMTAFSSESASSAEQALRDFVASQK